MSNENEATMMATDEVMDPNTVYATIIKDEEGNYHVVDFDGTVGPVCKLVDEGDRTIALTPNKSNRKWFNRKRAEEEIATKGHADLYYKATKVLGPNSARMPYEQLLKYLPEDERKEAEELLREAMALREADKKKPMTDLEKAQAQLEKAKAAYEKLLAQAAEITPAQ